jgi:F420-dependent oxidoreductase-like protein
MVPRTRIVGVDGVREVAMRFALMLEPQQGMSYLDQLAVARRAEAAGFEALFRSDHYSSFPGPTDAPTTDAWTVLAGLARETDRIGLGVLVSPVTFRHPGNLVKVATTVDEMSGGRVELGLGAGWHDGEHLAHGLDFPPIGERADILEEQLAILRGLWTEPDGWSFEGTHYRVSNAGLRPRIATSAGRPSGPGGARPRLIVGGEGSPRGLRIAARWADEFNVTSSDPDRVADRFRLLDAACRAIGRDPATMTRSAMIGVLVGAGDAEVANRARAVVAAMGSTSEAQSWLDARRARWILGTPEEARAAVRAFAAAGVERIMLQDFLPWDLAMIDLLGEELVGRV